MGNEGLLGEFARWLKERGYGDEATGARNSSGFWLYVEWDGSIVSLEAEKFLCEMARFSVEKVFGSGDSKFCINVAVKWRRGSYSEVYVLEMKTKTVLADLLEETSYFCPEAMERCLEHLIEELEESKKLLALRSPADL